MTAPSKGEKWASGEEEVGVDTSGDGEIDTVGRLDLQAMIAERAEGERQAQTSQTNRT